MSLLHQTFRFTLALSLLTSLSARADTNTVNMSVLPLLTDELPDTTCPESVQVLETPRPYQEGGYLIDGTAQLNSLAEDFSILRTDEVSVTWVANLKPPYQNCQATGSNVEGFPYLRLRFWEGQLYLILDMTGQTDANGYTASIIHKGVDNGNPTWTWGGSD